MCTVMDIVSAGVEENMAIANDGYVSCLASVNYSSVSAKSDISTSEVRNDTSGSGATVKNVYARRVRGIVPSGTNGEAYCTVVGTYGADTSAVTDDAAVKLKCANAKRYGTHFLSI